MQQLNLGNVYDLIVIISQNSEVLLSKLLLKSPELSVFGGISEYYKGVPPGSVLFKFEW